MMKLKWKECKDRLNIGPSPAEKRILNHLNRKKVKYYREVEFQGLTSKKNCNLYFDFYIPSKNLLIEYDGPHHLTDELTIENDKLKNEFVKLRGIKLKRLDRREWMLIEKIINGLLGVDYERVDDKSVIENKKKPKISKPQKGRKHRDRILRFKTMIKNYRSTE